MNSMAALSRISSKALRNSGPAAADPGRLPRFWGQARKSTIWPWGAPLEPSGPFSLSSFISRTTSPDTASVSRKVNPLSVLPTSKLMFRDAEATGATARFVSVGRSTCFASATTGGDGGAADARGAASSRPTEGVFVEESVIDMGG